MTMLVHRTAGSEELPFVLDDLKLHLRAPDDSEDAAIQNIGLTAAAEVEHFAQLALLTQTVQVSIFEPPCEAILRLPIGPADSESLPTVTIDGEAFAGFDFVGGNRPVIRWQAAFFDLSPILITVEYQAGFGSAAAAIPQDLTQALKDQAALHYDGRSPMDAKSLTMSPHMARIGARYRGVQL